MKVNKLCTLALSFSVAVLGLSYHTDAVSYCVKSYEASIIDGRFVDDSISRVDRSRKVLYLRGVKRLLSFEKWKRIKNELKKETAGDVAKIISLELDVEYKSMQSIFLELKHVFGVSHIYKEVLTNLDNMQAAYSNLIMAARG